MPREKGGARRSPLYPFTLAQINLFTWRTTWDKKTLIMRIVTTTTAP